jgi:HK97 family phage major capsid protein
MQNYSEMLPHITGSDYETHFWDALRGKQGYKEQVSKGVDNRSGALTLNPKGQSRYMAALEKEGLFRSLATDIRAYNYNYNIKTANGNDVAAWVEEGGTIPIADGMGDFSDIALKIHKLVVFLKLEEAFVKDATFKIEDYLVSRLAKNFGRAEDNGFINGTGENMPTGILAASGGAEVGVTTNAITYEDVVKLFFSVKPEYRRNGVWLMNDETALALRTLKDDGGNYIWNHANDTILGKKVCISEFMPSAGTGAKPIAFGDFSYYWIVGRRPLSIRTLTEQYALEDCIGYLAYEFLDGKLVRPEAIKVMEMTA